MSVKTMFGATTDAEAARRAHQRKSSINRIVDLESALEDMACAHRMLDGMDGMDDVAAALDALAGIVRTRLEATERGYGG